MLFILELLFDFIIDPLSIVLPRRFHNYLSCRLLLEGGNQIIYLFCCLTHSRFLQVSIADHWRNEKVEIGAEFADLIANLLQLTA